MANEAEPSELERILKALPALKKVIDVAGIRAEEDRFKSKLTDTLLNYRTDDNKTLEQLALDHGIQKEDFMKYVEHVANEKYTFLYIADYITSQLEDVLMGASGKEKGFASISKKFAGRTILLPAYLACYVAHKMINETLGQYLGLYDDGLKGRLAYAGDMLGLQINAIGDLAGMGKLVEKIGLANIPKRIEDTAIRDITSWIKTGKETRSFSQSQADWILEKLGAAVDKTKESLGKLKDYAAGINYAADRNPTYSMMGYAPLAN